MSITKSKYDNYIDAIKKSIKVTENEIEKVQCFDSIKLYQVNDLLRVIPKIPKLFQVANFSEKRKILTTISSNLSIKDKKVDIILRNPFSKLLKFDEDTKKSIY